MTSWKRILLLMLLAGCISGPTVFAQMHIDFKSDSGDSLVTVYILHADNLREQTIDSVKLQSLVGNVAMRKEKTLFYCDSVVINNNSNIVEAFGKVHMNDSDTTNIFSDYMKYFVLKKYVIFQKNVKMTDGDGTLFTDDLQYDMNQRTGVYSNGGKVLNGPSVLTSKEGTYYADTKDIYFRKDVVLKDPAYDLFADSLLYNTKTQLATFITQTHIRDSSGSTIDTREGNYDLKNRKAQFGKRPIIRQGAQTIIGDDVHFDDSTGISIATGNAVFIDTTEQVSVLANYLIADRKTKTFLATINPLMILKQQDDSIYITADTLFSGRLTDLLYADSVAKYNDSVRMETLRVRDSILDDSIKTLKTRITDSLRKVNEMMAREEERIRDSSELAHVDIADQAFLKWVVEDEKAILKKPEPGKNNRRKPPPKKDDAVVKEPVSKDSLAVSPPRTDSAAQKKIDSGTDSLKNRAAKNPGSDSLGLLPPIKGDSLTATKAVEPKDSTAGTFIVRANDSSNRYLQAYHHVRIFSDSLQAVSDSLFYSSQDSIFRLYTNPVVWANMNQITGDTIFLFTKNKKANRLYVFENGLVVNKVGPNLYNQMKGTTLNGYFKDGVIDYMRAKGNAESIYYTQDDNKAFFGVNQSKASIIDMIFVNKELSKVVLRNDAEGTMYPIKKVDFDEMRLHNFKWLEAKRPKTKYELFGK